MTPRISLLLVLAALWCTQVHAMAHAAHDLSAAEPVCVLCSAQQDDDSSLIPTAPVMVALATINAVVKAPQAPVMARFAPAYGCRGPPLELV